MTLSQQQVDDVRRLLATGGMSQRAVATIVGVSRATVGAIASGRRRDPRPPREDTGVHRPGPLVWCVGCGHDVYLIDGVCKTCETLGASAAELARYAAEGLARGARYQRGGARHDYAPRTHPAGIASPRDLRDEPTNPF